MLIMVLIAFGGRDICRTYELLVYFYRNGILWGGLVLCLASIAFFLSYLLRDLMKVIG